MKLITWNVQWFCGLDGRIDIGRVLRTAREWADFDVLCLQEVAVNYPALQGDASHDQPALLRAALPGFEVAFAPAVDELAADGRSRQRFGNLIATRLPLLQLQPQLLPYPADAGVRSMPRVALTATLRAAWGPLRVTTTHLEFYSQTQRAAQAEALRALHAQAAAQAAAPPLHDTSGGPFQAKAHTVDAILTGDFNCDAASPEYAGLVAPQGEATLHDSWRLRHGDAPQPPTFHVFDKRYSPDPVPCDFIFVSDSLRRRVRRVEVDSQTRDSDHQPVLLELDDGA